MAACSLLSQEHQSSRCELGLSFGCGSGYLWTAHGCAGRFLCEGKPLLCGVDRALCRCEGGRLPGGALALNGDGEGLAALYRREQRTSCAAHTTEIALGVLGNSITVGVGTVNAKRNCWPALLQSSLGPRYRIINRGVRASRADLATLCCLELFQGTLPDQVVVDYSFTSDTPQMLALVDRLHSFGVHTIVNLFCQHPGWLHLMRCTAPSENTTCMRKPLNSSIRAYFGSSLDVRGPPGLPLRRKPLAEQRTQAQQEILSQLPPNIRRRAIHLMWWGAHAISDGHIFEQDEGLHAAVVAAWHRCIFGPATNPFCQPNIELAGRLRRIVHTYQHTQSNVWWHASAAVAAGNCIADYNIWGTIPGVMQRITPYTSNVASLDYHVGELTAWAGHPNNLGHRLIAEPVAQLLEHWCPVGRLASNSSRIDDTICTYGSRVSSLIHLSEGFQRVDVADGRTGGVAATHSGARVQFRLVSRNLKEGFLTVGYERGWRNKGVVGRISCLSPCACQPIEMDAFNTRSFTGTSFTTSVWVQLKASGDGSYECMVEGRVMSLVEGRLMLQAMTLAAPFAGNRSTLVQVGGRGLSPFLETTTDGQTTAF